MRVIAPDTHQYGTKLLRANLGDVVEYTDAPGVFYIVVLDTTKARAQGTPCYPGGLYAHGDAIRLVNAETGHMVRVKSLSARVHLHKNVELSVGERS